jgi:hypothetical protein
MCCWTMEMLASEGNGVVLKQTLLSNAPVARCSRAVSISLAFIFTLRIR